MILPSQMNQARVNEFDLHYADIGKGEALLLIHGGGATDSRTWTPVVDRLAKHYRVIVPSLRYHYPNQWVGDGSDYIVETHARDMAALLKSLGTAPAHVAGSSMGADIALMLGRDYPDLLRTLILGEPGLPNWLDETRPAEDREAENRDWEMIHQAVVQGEYEKALRLFSDAVLGDGMFDRLPETTRQRIMDNVRVLALLLPTIESQTRFTRQEAGSITTPTLLLRGDSSPKQFLLAEAELAKTMPGAERALIPNTAHLLHGMNPQVFCDVVLSFLARH